MCSMTTWLGYRDTQPQPPEAAVLQSGADEYVLDNPHDGTIVDFVVPGLLHSTTAIGGVDYDILSSTNGYWNGRPGSPVLPTEGHFIAIPHTCVLERIQAVALEFEVLDGLYDIPAHPDSDGNIVPDEAIYTRNAYYPDNWLVDLGETHLSGVKVRHVLLYLAKYNPIERRVIGLIKLRLRIVYNSDRSIPARHVLAKPDVTSSLVLDIASVLYRDNYEVRKRWRR